MRCLRQQLGVAEGNYHEANYVVHLCVLQCNAIKQMYEQSRTET